MPDLKHNDNKTTTTQTLYKQKTPISILAAIALPAYQDYISKSQTTRVVGELAAAKTAVDAAIFEGRNPGLVDSKSSTVTSAGGTATTKTTIYENIGLTTGTNGSVPRSNLMGSVALKGFETDSTDVSKAISGHIAATLGNNANKDIHGTQIAQVRSEEAVWTCEVIPANSKGWKDKFIPNGCSKVAKFTAPK